MKNNYEDMFVVEKPQSIEQIFPRSETDFPYTLVKIWEVIPEIERLKGRHVSLRDLTLEDRQAIASCGTSKYSALWLNGLEKRSEASRQLAESRLGDFRPLFSEVSSDNELKGKLIGSAFAPTEPIPDPSIAANWDEVRKFADDMRNETGVKVWGDFIANHFAVDSPLISQHPDWFVHKPTSPTENEEADFFPITKGDKTYWTARARWSRNDKYGAQKEPWADIAQLDILNPEVQEFLIADARDKGGIFDGLRVDAAALTDEEVFVNNWGDLVPEEAENTMKRLRDKPEERLWSRVCAAARSAAEAAGRNLTITGETFHNFGKVNELKEVFGQVYDVGWQDAIIKTLTRKVNVADLAVWLHDNIDTLRKETLYVSDQDQPSIVERLGSEKAIVANLAMMLLPAGSYLVGPLQEDGYAGGKLDVNLREFPRIQINQTIKKTYTQGMIVKNSQLFQNPDSRYTILPVWQQVTDTDAKFHSQILPMQVTSGSGQEVAVVCTNFRPEEKASMYIPIPNDASDLTVVDLTTGKLITNSAEVVNGKLYIELGPDKLAQVVHYKIAVAAAAYREAA